MADINRLIELLLKNSAAQDVVNENLSHRVHGLSAQVDQLERFVQILLEAHGK